MVDTLLNMEPLQFDAVCVHLELFECRETFSKLAAPTLHNFRGVFACVCACVCACVWQYYELCLHVPGLSLSACVLKGH